VDETLPARQIKISTEEFIHNQAPLLRLFISQIMDLITHTILNHVDQSDLHNYDAPPEDQPEYINPALLAKVTQYTTFIMPLDTTLNADDMF
jgi:hypothetical protein